MDERDPARDHEIGALVDYWLRRRGMTRQIFADRMGKSVSWVDKVRRGERRLDRLSVLARIADVLDVSLATLVDPDEARRSEQCADQVEIAQLCDALQRYDGMMGEIGRGTDVPDLSKLRRSVHYGWTSYQASNYQIVTRMLPELLAGLHRAYRALDGDAQAEAATLLTQTYWVAVDAAMKFGRADLGRVAADRGMSLAESTGDLALIGFSASHVVHVMFSTPDLTSRANAIALARTVADRLEPGIGGASPAYLSAYGMLLLKGSIAAARMEDASVSRDLNAEAAAVARLLGADRNEHWSAFGPTNVGVHRFAALADLREGDRVADAATTLTPEHLGMLPRERRASHLLAVARGYTQWGKRDQAIELILDADALAREEVRCRPGTRSLVGELLRGHPRGTRPAARFTRLAREMGTDT